MVLITYDNQKIHTIQENPEGGVTRHPQNRFSITTTIEDAKAFFEMKGFDTTKIDEYEPVNDKFTQ